MSARFWSALSLLFLSAFAACGYLIAFRSASVSESPVATDLVLGLTAVSLFAWPVCMARAFQTYLKGRPPR